MKIIYTNEKCSGHIDKTIEMVRNNSTSTLVVKDEKTKKTFLEKAPDIKERIEVNRNEFL